MKSCGGLFALKKQPYFFYPQDFDLDVILYHILMRLQLKFRQKTLLDIRRKLSYNTSYQKIEKQLY